MIDTEGGGNHLHKRALENADFFKKNTKIFPEALSISGNKWLGILDGDEGFYRFYLKKG